LANVLVTFKLIPGDAVQELVKAVADVFGSGVIVISFGKLAYKPMAVTLFPNSPIEFEPQT
jgi:hypothetical protein